MKKVFMQGIIFPFLLLFVISCQKEDMFPEQNNTKQPVALRNEANGSCRLTLYDLYDGIDESHRIQTFTYKNGLVENVITYYGWRFTMIYDAKNKLIASKVFIDDLQVGLVEFTYEQSKVVKETWLNPETRELEDEVFYTYNQQGNLERGESFMYEIYTNYTYTTNGNLESNQIFIGGLPWFKAEYTYKANYKNPYRAVEGLVLQFWHTNAGFGAGPNWYTSEKVTLYDENGEPFIHYEQDPAKTTWVTAPQKYPLMSSYVDKYTQAPITNNFEYENCVPGQSTPAENFVRSQTPGYTGLRDVKARIFHYPSRYTIEKLMQGTLK
jgi:hypothetical protein